MNINRGANTKSHWEHKHQEQYDLDKSYTYEDFGDLSYVKIAYDILVSNKNDIQNKSILELGCADGRAIGVIKQGLPEFDCYGWDFGVNAIQAAQKNYQRVVYETRDFLLHHIDQDYGAILLFETIEHIEEGRNYEVLDNILDHCEYAIISTPDTEDDCGGEHISHYKLDTFEQKGYDVIWKSYLKEIYMPDGVYHYMIFLIRGKLC